MPKWSFASHWMSLVCALVSLLGVPMVVPSEALISTAGVFSMSTAVLLEQTKRDTRHKAFSSSAGIPHSCFSVSQKPVPLRSLA